MASEHRSSPRGLGRRVGVARALVVDDEEGIRLLCRINLELDGHVVAEAADGRSALALVHTFRPEVVFLDVMMPVINGWAVLAALKSDAATSGIPVVMLTAVTADAERVRGWKGGVLEYLTKPFDPEALGAVATRVIDLASPERALERRRWVLAQLRSLSAES